MIEPPSRWKVFVEVVDTHVTRWMDAALDHVGCTIASVIGIVVLICVLGIGFIAYSSYIHRNQHCVLAYREYVVVGHTLTPEDVCQQWQNN